MISSDAQSLEAGELVVLYEVDLTPLGAEVLRFHPYNRAGNIRWQGREYSPWPMEASGFEMSGTSLPSPKVRMGNVNGAISALCIAYDDLSGVVVTRHRTMAKYLDGQPEADPEESFPVEIWIIEQKIAETRELVEFELSSALDFGGVQLPRRQIIANSCLFEYRSAECSYTGPPVATNMDIITTDARLDRCSRKVSGCKLRFGNNNELPYGGFPASGMT